MHLKINTILKSKQTAVHYFNAVLLSFIFSFSLFGEAYNVGENRTFDKLDFHIPIPDASGFEELAAPVSDSIQNLMIKIQKLSALIEEEGRFLDRLNALYEVTYPIGISKTIGGQNYTIVLDSDEITPEGAFINAYMSFPIPQTGRQLAFAATRIPLSAEGGINGVIELALLADEPINLGKESRLIVYGCDSKGVYHTKVRFDCAGFVDMVIDAGIEFSKSVFICEDPKTGIQQPDKPLAARFTTTIKTWSDMIVEVSLPPFQVTSLKGFGFEVQQAAFDFSDLNNPAGIVFPKDYLGIEVYGDLPELWQGFYFRQVTLRLPPELKDGERMEILAQNIIIDELGLSGTFAANNLLTLDQGSIGGWAFSLNHIELNLVANSVTNAKMNGEMALPIQKEGQTINYAAIIDQKGDFLFTASMPKDMSVPMFAESLTVDKSSSLTIEKKDDDFIVLAKLHGKININAPIGGGGSKSAKGLSLSGIRFQDMQISNRYPNFRPGVWSVNEIGYSGDGLNGFGVSISGIETLEPGNGGVGVKFTAKVNFSGDKYCASTTLSLWATSEVVDGKDKWKYKNMEIHELYLKVNDEVISIEGYFAVYKKDPTYGDGFAGMIKAKFLAFGIQAKAMFGEVDGFKYFYVDAFVDLSNMPITMGTIGLYGFGGGVYHHMKQIPLSDNPLANAPAEGEESTPIINYQPDKSTFLGFKATVALGIAGNPTAFHAIATFEITFNSNMGLKTVAFYGEGFLMTKMDLQNPNKDAPIYASVYIGYDVPEKTFHGNFKVYINAAGGMIRGINPGNLAGEIVIHVDPVDWYIHVGRPATRVGVELNVLGFSIKSGTYFMMGTKIDDMPPPPEKVLTLLDMKPPSRPEGGNMSLRGFAFGTEFSISTGDLQLLIFYAKFELGLGFDIILADRSDFVCAHNNESPGMNGWYAEGQLYTYVMGEIGIKIKIFGANIQAEILSIGAAALLEAKLPNPYWMRGTVGGYYSLLGGRIKGSCKFDFELGQLCEFVRLETHETSPVEGLTVISTLTPDNGKKDVDIFSAPQTVFNFEINSQFTISDNVSSKEYFKVVLDKFEVLTPDKKKINGEYAWNNDRNVLVFNPHEILPGETTIELISKIHFEKKIDNKWQVVKVNGEIVIEEKTSEFTTGIAPDYIPDNNVSYSYPLKDMMNLYKNESSTGYVQLNQGQAYLFETNDEWLQFGRFTPMSGGQPIYIHYKYNPGAKNIDHIIPAVLNNNTVYKFDLVNIPASEAGAIDQNIVQKTSSKESGAGNMTFTENKAKGSLTIKQEKVLYTCFLRTSYYNTMAAKVNDINPTWLHPTLLPFITIIYKISGTLHIFS